MITYLIKTVACSGVFLLAYLLFLEREKMHRFNRWYLLGSIILSFIVPLINIPVAQEMIPVLNDAYIINWEPGNIVSTRSESAAAVPSIHPLPAPASSFRIPVWAIVYALITLLLLLRFARNVYRLATAAWTREIIRYQGVPLVVVKGDISSYTFFNTIFISEADYPLDGTTSPVLTHELAHVKQKHSWDVLFIELVRVFCWFNPVLLFYKKAIQLNHEFLADAAVIDAETDIPSYQHLLLDKIGRGAPVSLSSSFNYSITKKRLVMMRKQPNSLVAAIKKLSLVPLLGAIIFAFCSKEISAQAKTGEPVKAATNPQKIDDRDQNKFPPVLRVGDMAAGPGATSKEMEEYNALITKNLKKESRQKIKMPLTANERDRMLQLFTKMTSQQRRETKIGFQKRLDPWQKAVPTTAQFESWKNPANYGVWIDGRKISNEKLNDYKPSDFGHYYASNLNYTEAMKKDVMKRFNLKVMYKVQLDLMTKEEYKRYYDASMAEPPYSMYYHVTYDSAKKREIDWRVRIYEQEGK